MGDKLKEFWLAQGIKLLPGAAEGELLAFETKYAIQLPEDFRQYLSAVNGFDGGETWTCDENLVTFLGLADIKPLSEYWSHRIAGAADFFVFADYSISAHVYAICLRNSSIGQNEVVVVYDSKLVVIASSFSEFSAGYLNSVKALLFPAVTT